MKKSLYIVGFSLLSTLVVEGSLRRFSSKAPSMARMPKPTMEYQAPLKRDYSQQATGYLSNVRQRFSVDPVYQQQMASLRQQVSRVGTQVAKEAAKFKPYMKKGAPYVGAVGVAGVTGKEMYSITQDQWNQQLAKKQKQLFYDLLGFLSRDEAKNLNALLREQGLPDNIEYQAVLLAGAMNSSQVCARLILAYSKDPEALANEAMKYAAASGMPQAMEALHNTGLVSQSVFDSKVRPQMQVYAGFPVLSPKQFKDSKSYSKRVKEVDQLWSKYAAGKVVPNQKLTNSEILRLRNLPDAAFYGLRKSSHRLWPW